MDVLHIKGDSRSKVIFSLKSLLNFLEADFLSFAIVVNIPSRGSEKPVSMTIFNYKASIFLSISEKNSSAEM